MTQLEKCYDNALVLDLDQIMRDIGFQVIYQDDPSEKQLEKLKKKARKKAKASLTVIEDAPDHMDTCFNALYNDILDRKLEAFRSKKRIILKPSAPINIINRINDNAGQYFGFNTIHMDADSTQATYEINRINVHTVHKVDLDMSEKCFMYDSDIGYVAWYIIHDYCHKLIRAMYDNVPILFRINTESAFWTLVCGHYTTTFINDVINHSRTEEMCMTKYNYSVIPIIDTYEPEYQLFVLRTPRDDAMNMINEFMKDNINWRIAREDTKFAALMKEQQNRTNLIDVLNSHRHNLNMDFSSCCPIDTENTAKTIPYSMNYFNPFYRQIIPAELRSNYVVTTGEMAIIHMCNIIGIVNVCRLLNITIDQSNVATSVFHGIMVKDADGSDYEYDFITQCISEITDFIQKLNVVGVNACCRRTIDLDLIKNQLTNCNSAYNFNDADTEKDLRWAVALGIMFSIIPDRLEYAVASDTEQPLYVTEIIDPSDRMLPFDDEFCANDLSHYLGATVFCTLPELNQRVVDMIMYLQYRRTSDPSCMIKLIPYEEVTKDTNFNCSVIYSYDTNDM